ncbi:hypothetical protein E1301_Tti021105 [Triplophysa tibetana]|uniref:G-protein coupled receptors family 1 profile domain-containing protein n=1 Tax=Triplophysa tibetana TaxID=1572043 RepID=A0A5A9NE89_9TELE|nr:hypothetical protein E1301_Tti021105 [Triplophysa tibetana]
MTEHNITNNQSDNIMAEDYINNSQSERSNEWELYKSFPDKQSFARSVFIWILSVVEIPIMLLTLYALCCLIKSHRTASVFVIHLILSDLIQLICLILMTWEQTFMLLAAHFYTLIVVLRRTSNLGKSSSGFGTNNYRCRFVSVRENKSNSRQVCYYFSVDSQQFHIMTEHNITNNQSDNIMAEDYIINSQSERSNEWELNSFLDKLPFARSVFIWILSVVEIPIMLLTLYALCCLIKSHQTASVFVIHLILSDLIQLICLILMTWDSGNMLLAAHEYSVIVGVYFMACVAFERYLLVSHPIWHKTHQTLKSSCLISLIIWFVPLIFGSIRPHDLRFEFLWVSVALLIPYPVIIVCFVGTWRGLSHAISLTSQKRRMILGTLFLVLLSYMFIILPYSIVCLFNYITDYEFWDTVSFQKVFRFVDCLLYLNPLTDCLLYLFMRTDAADLLPSLHCCRRSDTHQISIRYTTRTTQPSS